ncbi:Oligosaccharide biosynthesis protein Alg14 like family protein [Theileria parva strain Muguga]|uniref:Oligosaccharide biosynthesis protein Alg14 like family protein n=1 Tax=Theileria parva strain Muguga TaxID=333668 RepID=UPI001C61732C|nr:Oligosaccharide biosynthesis protein Alg14 like family protein [Theileria parva strain Muguga]KAF5153350.1 Oligosaccharide biosynthesis protein Alg14 like family protein [Theileria parva strain Muguga]
MIYFLFTILFLIPNFLILVFLYRRYGRYARVRKKEKSKHKIIMVLGPGGHTREMVEIFSLLDHEKYDFEFVHSKYDRISPKVFLNFFVSILNRGSEDVDATLDEETVKRRFFHSITFPSNKSLLRLFFAIFFLPCTLKSIAILYKVNPDIVITNGPALSVPFCLSVKLLNVLLFRNSKVVYVESLTRVKTISDSGRVLYNFVDGFLVLWPFLKSKYKKFNYIGTIEKLTS